jgi:hypothetical protein
MNTGRYLIAVLAVWVVRVVCNFLFYGFAMMDSYQELADAHPGIFREVIPAYVVIDLFVALVFTFLVVKGASCFGGGVKGGLMLGVYVGLIAAVAVDAYRYYSFAIFELGGTVIDAVYQLVVFAVLGAVAAAIYKPGPGTSAAPSPGV